MVCLGLVRQSHSYKIVLFIIKSSNLMYCYSTLFINFIQIVTIDWETVILVILVDHQKISDFVGFFSIMVMLCFLLGNSPPL